MAPHSSILAWKIPLTEEPGRLQSMGSQRVRQDWATSLSFSIFGVLSSVLWGILQVASAAIHNDEGHQATQKVQAVGPEIRSSLLPLTEANASIFQEKCTELCLLSEF